jgi:hypothetical protein
MSFTDVENKIPVVENNNQVVNAIPSESNISNVEPLFNQLLSKLKTNLVTIIDEKEKDNKIKEYLSELDILKSELDKLKPEPGYFDWFNRAGGKTNKNKKRKNKTKKMKKRK